MSDLKKYFKGRWKTWGKLIICITGEAIVFLVWVLVAALCQLVANWLEAHGLREIFAEIFRWVSSIGTLVLTVIYIIVDIIEEVRNLFHK